VEETQCISIFKDLYGPFLNLCVNTEAITSKKLWLFCCHYSSSFPHLSEIMWQKQ